jgi:hypothetical protein
MAQRSAQCANNITAEQNTYELLCRILLDIPTDLIKVIEEYCCFFASFKADYHDQQRASQYFYSLKEVWEYMLGELRYSDDILISPVDRISSHNFPSDACQDVIDIDSKVIGDKCGIAIVAILYRGCLMLRSDDFFGNANMFLCEFAKEHNLPYWEPASCKLGDNRKATDCRSYMINVTIRHKKRYFSSPTEAWNYIKNHDDSDNSISVRWPVNCEAYKDNDDKDFDWDSDLVPSVGRTWDNRSQLESGPKVCVINSTQFKSYFFSYA